MIISDSPYAATRQVCIIVPVYQQWEMVPYLVAGLRAQGDAFSTTDVLLIDNGSANFNPPGELPPNVMVVSCDAPGSYAARNYGVSLTSAELLIFTDADCRPQAGWLMGMLAALREHPNDVVAGDVHVVAGSADPNPYEIYDMLRGIPQRRYVQHGYAATANLGVSRKIFDRLHGFDLRRKSGGDADFCRRATASGSNMHFQASAVVDHPARSTWLELTIKARRVKGGQFRHTKARGGRLKVVLETLVHPLLDVSRFLFAQKWPLRYRVMAILVRFRLWFIELRELGRLAFGAPEERR